MLLLSPLGLACAVVVASVAILGAVLNVAVMTGVIHSGEESALPGLRAGLGCVVARAPALLGFAARLLARVLLIAAPFLLARTAGRPALSHRVRHQLLSCRSGRPSS